jgi:hypothetical protein
MPKARREAKRFPSARAVRSLCVRSSDAAALCCLRGRDKNAAGRISQCSEEVPVPAEEMRRWGRSGTRTQRGPGSSRRVRDLLTKPVLVLGLRPPLAVDARTGMKTRKLGTVFVLLAAMPWLIGCETVRDSPNPQFEKQVQRAQECRQIQAKLVGDHPVTPERAEEIAKTMTPTGCAARLPGYY